MGFHPQERLDDRDVERALRNVLRDGMASQALVTLTEGVFLVAFALEMGASNLTIGALAAIPAMAQLLQAPAVALVERIRNRRAITFYASSVGRLGWLFAASIPLFAPGPPGLVLLLGAVAFQGVFSAVANCAWHSWMHDLVPSDRLGSFFSTRKTRAVAVGVGLRLAAAAYLDLWATWVPELPLASYSVLFLVAWGAGLASSYFVSRTPEPRMPAPQEPVRLTTLLRKPLADDNFRRLLVFLGSWNFALYLAAPFFAVYMLERLGLSLSLVIAFTVISQLMNVTFLKVWGRLSDRFGHKPVLSLVGPVSMFSILGWTFTTLPERHLLTLPLLTVIHMLYGMSTAGVLLGASNIALKLAPQGEATAYLATSNLVNSLAAGVAPIVGGTFVDFFDERQLSLTLTWRRPGAELSFETMSLQHWDFFFLLAFVIGLFSLHRLGHVREVGEMEEDLVIEDLLAAVRREGREPATIAGLRQAILWPLSLWMMRGRRDRAVPDSGSPTESVPPDDAGPEGTPEPIGPGPAGS